jgi:ABC-type branched-subunit amino acid transport system substrate-binding protein
MRTHLRGLFKFSKHALCLGAVGFTLTACSGIAGLDTLNPTKPAVIATPEPVTSAPVSGSTIGTGSVRVGLILPLSSPNGAAAATALRNAAELALSEFQSQDVMLLVKDDLGTTEGAANATKQAINEGAELIIGPLFANSVQAASKVAQGAGKSMIAFSSDESVASRGVYLMSFTPQADVERMVGYAIEKNRRSFAILAPDSTYGNLAVQNFEQKVRQAGGRILATERYNGSTVTAAAQRLKANIAGADALFIPEDAANLQSVAQALSSANVDISKVLILGTGVWNQPAIFKISQFQGAVFPAPESTGFNSFAQRYKAKFGQNPVRIATLGFDATALVAALTKTQGTKRFQENVLTNASGFSGQDGVFRFRSDGTNDRALAVFQLGTGRASVVSAAPKGFAK